MSVKFVSVVIPLKKQDLSWKAWVQLRREDGPLDGQYEFPGGKIESGETSFQAAARELKEEVAVEYAEEQFSLFQITRHDYSDRKVCLHFHLLEVKDEQSGWSRGQWCDLGDIPKHMLEANRPIVEKLKDYLEQEPNLGEWK
ncbi:MAG: 8-oxo-dGTP diphosphatase MutT [Halobacteriovorax sp.]|nr:8-oxo-dGTP diphosphatase MutT [Halobacteriovorax sp.]